MLSDYMKKMIQEIASIENKNKIIKRMNVAGGIITKKGDNDEDLFLLIQRARDDHFPLVWEFPRGKCDGGKKGHNENIIDCLKREIKEETGLNIKPVKYIDKFSYIADNGTRESIQYNYLCKLIDDNQEIKLSNEHDDYKWITSLGIVELSTMPEIKKTMSKIMNQDNSIVSYDESELYKHTIEENTINNYLNKIQKG